MSDIIKRFVPLKDYNTFKIGGNAEYFAEPADLAQLCQVLAFADSADMPITILGGGANVLIPDGGISGLVLRTAGLCQIKRDGVRITAECGVPVDTLVDFAAECGLSGAEFAAGLPGSVGGAVYMNARCYGSEFADIVESVRVLRAGQNSLTELKKSELDYAYKHSRFMSEPNAIIYDVTFCLSAGNTDEIRTAGEANREDRRKKGQYAYPSAGCAFRNNYAIGVPTGKLIQDAGLKGTRIGGAQIFDRHANFIVNVGDAKAEDVRQLVALIQKTLAERGYEVEPEIKILQDKGEPQ